MLELLLVDSGVGGFTLQLGALLFQVGDAALALEQRLAPLLQLRGGRLIPAAHLRHLSIQLLCGRLQLCECTRQTCQNEPSIDWLHFFSCFLFRFAENGSD